jgi:hypothetical protein
VDAEDSHPAAPAKNLAAGRLFDGLVSAIALTDFYQEGEMART